MGEVSEMTVNSWVNKQLWRVKQTYIVFQPMANIVQLLLWGIIAIGVNEWFSLTWELFAVIVLGTLLVLNLVGYGFDKKGFFLEHTSRQFKIALPKLWSSQMQTLAVFIAQSMRMDDDDLERTIAELFKELGIE